MVDVDNKDDDADVDVGGCDGVEFGAPRQFGISCGYSVFDFHCLLTIYSFKRNQYIDNTLILIMCK